VNLQNAWNLSYLLKVRSMTDSPPSPHVQQNLLRGLSTQSTTINQLEIVQWSRAASIHYPWAGTLSST